MERTLSKDLIKSLNQQVLIEGWLHKKRKMGGLNFLLIRDLSGLVQVLVEDEAEMEKLRGAQIGTVLKIKGNTVEDERAPSGVEIHEPTIEVSIIVQDEPPIEIDKPIDHKPENLDTLFEYRPLSLRNLNERTIFLVQDEITRQIREFLHGRSFTEIRTPKLLAEATEGGAEVFQLDYFGKTATLAQSPQFYKQMMVGVFERVFEIAPVFRAEPSATTRHISEYISVDGEMGFISFSDLQELLGEMLIKLNKGVWDKYEEQLKKWNASPAVLPEDAKDIPRLTIHEIHEMFFAATKEDHRGEDDLAPAEEKWICEWSKKNKKSDAVFVIGWPANSKTFKFYHRKNQEDASIADRADLLFRGVEITTLSMREHRYNVVLEQLKLGGGDLNNPGYKAFLSVFKYGMPPHGGFGLGLERLTQKIIGLNNVKEASLFPRDINRLAP